MPYYYFDSTALVKRYSMERGTRIINRLMVKRGKVAILPTWTVTDFYTAFSNRAGHGDITRDDCYSVLHKFEKESQEGLYQFIASDDADVSGNQRAFDGVSVAPDSTDPPFGFGSGTQVATVDRRERGSAIVDGLSCGGAPCHQPGRRLGFGEVLSAENCAKETGLAALVVDDERVDNGFPVSGCLLELEGLCGMRPRFTVFWREHRACLLEAPLGQREASADTGRGRQLSSGPAKEGHGAVAMFL